MTGFLDFLTPVLLLLLTLVLGLWLSRLGKPYNTFVFTLHKLAALGAVVLLVMRFTSSRGNTAFLPALLLGLAALGMLALFASGAL